MTNYKLHETKKDLYKEGCVVEELKAVFEGEFVKLPIAYHADYAVLRDNRVVGLIEIRTRIKKYDTIWLSVQKRIGLLQLANSLDVPMIFAVRYPDGLYYIDVNEKPCYFGKGYRNNMRDDRDLEIVCNYSTKRLKRLKTPENSPMDRWYVDNGILSPKMGLK